ncbi:acyltransferase [Phytoactinopolyspora alkaliphila]|nr:acyltransferase [Phytoactinopolyspora alkaliphila]
MSGDLRSRFARCGEQVVVEPGVHIEHPELFSVGDRVRIGQGFTSQGISQVTLASDVTIYPWCFVQGAGQVTLAEQVELFPNTYLSTGSPDGLIHIGRKTHLAAGCALYGGRKITLGAYCGVAAHVVLTSVEHDTRRHARPMVLSPSTGRPVSIADDVWIGATATVTPGTFVAEGCIIGAGAVVTRDTEPYGIYGGVPARRLREREIAP